MPLAGSNCNKLTALITPRSDHTFPAAPTTGCQRAAIDRSAIIDPPAAGNLPLFTSGHSKLRSRMEGVEGSAAGALKFLSLHAGHAVMPSVKIGRRRLRRVSFV